MTPIIGDGHPAALHPKSRRTANALSGDVHGWIPDVQGADDVDHAPIFTTQR